MQLLLDAVVDFLPSPLDRAAGAGHRARRPRRRRERKPDPKEPFSGLAFKTITEPTGDLVFVRIYSGELHPKDEVLNTVQQAQSSAWPASSA